MTEELIFIHLVSEQTLQNLLPILAFQPTRIVQVRSCGRHQKQALSTQSAVEYFAGSCPEFQNYRPHFVEHELSEANPTVNRVYTELAQFFTAAGRTVVNYTGGTKMMSVGLFQLALQRGASTVYCDTAKQRFVWAPEERVVVGLNFRHLAQLITVSLLVTANGLPWDELRWREPTSSYLGFGRLAWSFKRKASAVFIGYEKQLRAHFRRRRNKIPSKRAELEALLVEPLPCAPDPTVAGYLGSAAQQGLLREDEGRFFLRCKSSNSKDLRRQLESLSNLLDGSWLELFIVGLLQKVPAFGDVKWSLEPLGQQEKALGETDIVCVDRRACLLRVISCKQSLLSRSPLEHMEALVGRSRTLGGSQARPMLAVLRVQEHEQKRYRNWAQLLGIELLLGDEIEQRFLAPEGTN